MTTQSAVISDYKNNAFLKKNTRLRSYKMNIDYLLQKASNDERLTRAELVRLLEFPCDSFESYRMMSLANETAKRLTDNTAEVHGQFSLNLSPCGCNCKFCSFAGINKIFTKSSELSAEEAVANARLFERNGANSVFVMTTAGYPLEKFLEISAEIRKNLKKETVLIANVGDQTIDQAKRIKDAGYHGVYHALRMREGTDTGINPEKRKTSINNFIEAGLKVGTCIEPIGPEHTNEEIADMIIYTGSFNAAFSGAMRRITIPGGALEKYGMISELRMAQIVAVTRLGIPHSIKGNCTHEPCTLGAIAGANLFWAEIGANPRDTVENTENGRGDTVDHCKKLFRESEWNVSDRPSQFF